MIVHQCNEKFCKSLMPIDYLKEVELTRRITEEEATKRDIEETKRREIEERIQETKNRRISMVLEHPKMNDVAADKLVSLMEKLAL